MTTTNIRLPYREDTGLDRKNNKHPKSGPRHFGITHKSIYNVDIKQILTNDTVRTDSLVSKEPEIKQDSIGGAGPSAIEIFTKGEFRTNPETIKTDKLIQLFREYSMLLAQKN